MNAYCFIAGGVGVLTDTGTDDGYSTLDIRNTDQYRFWKTTPGGTLNTGIYSGVSQGYDVLGIIIVAPNGEGIGGDVTARLYDVSDVLQGTLTIKNHTLPGLVDRRIVFFENESWHNYITRIEFDFPANSEVSYIGMIINVADDDSYSDGPFFRDISLYLQRDWSIQITPVGKLSDGGGSFFYGESENLKSLRTFSGVIGPLEESTFNWKSFFLRKTYDQFMTVVPKVVQHDDSDANNKLMNMTAVFGRLTGNYSATYVAKKADSGEELYNIPIVVNEAG